MIKHDFIIFIFFQFSFTKTKLSCIHKELNNSRDKLQKKVDILDLNKYLGQRILIKFHGGREVTGVLKGFDALLNLVLDEVTERLRDYEDWHLLDETRLVCRGTAVVFIAPVEGMKEISNTSFLKEIDKGLAKVDEENK